MIYFTADTHFSHKNIIKYENRPFSNIEEMDGVMINNWNNRVKDSDEIFILGDFMFGTGRQANDILRVLNGRKYLIRGNHDSFLKDRNFDRSLFEWIKDYHVLKYQGQKYVLFHYPIQVWDCKHYNSIHLYGHVHSNISDHPMQGVLSNACNVGVDVNRFTPISIQDVGDIIMGI